MTASVPLSANGVNNSGAYTQSNGAANLFDGSVTTADLKTTQLATPGAPTGTATTGTGTLAAGTYYAKIVGVGLNGGMTPGGTESAAVTLSATGEIAWTWPVVTGAATYELWVGTASGAENTFVGSLTSTSYTQTAALASGTMPTTNTTGSASVFGIENAGGYTQSGTSANTFTGTVTVPGLEVQGTGALGELLNEGAYVQQGTADNTFTGATTFSSDVTAAGLYSTTNTTIAVSSNTQAANTCSTAASVTITGVSTSGAGSHISAGYTSDPASLTGWGSTGGMVFHIWPSAANTAEWEVCNQTAASITYSAITFSIGVE